MPISFSKLLLDVVDLLALPLDHLVLGFDLVVELTDHLSVLLALLNQFLSESIRLLLVVLDPTGLILEGLHQLITLLLLILELRLEARLHVGDEFIEAISLLHDLRRELRALASQLEDLLLKPLVLLAHLLG